MGGYVDKRNPRGVSSESVPYPALLLRFVYRYRAVDIVRPYFALAVKHSFAFISLPVLSLVFRRVQAFDSVTKVIDNF